MHDLAWPRTRTPVLLLQLGLDDAVRDIVETVHVDDPETGLLQEPVPLPVAALHARVLQHVDVAQRLARRRVAVRHDAVADEQARRRVAAHRRRRVLQDREARAVGPVVEDPLEEVRARAWEGKGGQRRSSDLNGRAGERRYL